MPRTTTDAKRHTSEINTVACIGRVVNDIVLRYTSSGRAVANFRIAVHDRTATSFVPCVAWGQLAELSAKYLYKGRKIGVRGRLTSSSWVANGKPQSKVDIVLSELQFLDSPRKEMA